MICSVLVIHDASIPLSISAKEWLLPGILALRRFKLVSVYDTLLRTCRNLPRPLRAGDFDTRMFSSLPPEAQQLLTFHLSASPVRGIV